MQRFLLLTLVACSSAPPPAAPQPPAVPTLDEPAAIARVHEFFAAVDSRDVAAFQAIVTPEYFLFEDGFARPAAGFVKRWNESKQPPHTRTCEDEAVRLGEGAIVYTGDCVEVLPAASDSPEEEYRGWNTVVLVPAGDTWKVALWQWERSGMAAARARWNEAYRRGTWFTHEPNRLLSETVAGLEPGRALVLAMGQGRNALHLAAQGWTVTGVDIAAEGLRQAREAADAQGLTIDAVMADIDEWDFGVERWDLITMVYAGDSLVWADRIKAGMKPGGVYVYEFFYKAPDDTTSPGGIAPAALEKAFADWEILKSEVVTDVADWGKRETELVRFVARKPGG